jgi:hypothetical protein
MSKNLQNWKRLGASDYILTIIAGIVINIEDSVTFKTLKQPLFTREQQSFLKETFAKYKEAGAVERCSNPRAIHLYFLVPKVGKSPFRWISDLRNINPYVTTRKFKLEGIQVVLSLITEGDFMFVADLSSGYFQLKIYENSRDLLAFKYEGEYWRYTVLPFGYSLAPLLFTKALS